MITSVTNKTVQRIASYSSRGRSRREDKVFVIEGIRMLREAPAEDIREIYFTEGYIGKALKGPDKELLNRLTDDSRIATDTVADIVMNRMADTRTPQGVLAVVAQHHYSTDDILGRSHNIRSGKNLLLILEDVQDPGNIGTMFRAGEAAGVKGHVLSPACADVYSPKVVRSTMGAIFRMPFMVCKDLTSFLKTLKDTKIYAAAMDAEKCYDRCDYTGNTAFLIGNEGAGLSAELRSCADTGIYIPMLGQVESLNAAITASLLSFEAARQRRCS